MERLDENKALVVRLHGHVKYLNKATLTITLTLVSLLGRILCNCRLLIA